MQNVGFAFSMAPLLRPITDSQRTFQAMLRRQLMFFNTHPYFSPIVMGVIYFKEKARQEGQDEEDPTLTVLKDSMGGAFGAMGDHVIWGPGGRSVRFWLWRWGRWWPIPRGPANLFPMVGGWVPDLVQFGASLAALVGLQKAVQDGPLVVRWIESLHMQAWAAQVRRMGLLLLVAIVLIYLGHWTRSNLLVWMMGVFLAVVVLKRWAVSGFIIFYGVCALSVILGWVGFIEYDRTNFNREEQTGPACPACRLVRADHQSFPLQRQSPQRRTGSRREVDHGSDDAGR